MTSASPAAANRRIITLAGDRSIHAAFRWLQLHEPRLRQWQRELLAIPAPPFAEAFRAQWFIDRFFDLGLNNVHLDAEGNALAELRSAPEQESDLKHAVILSAARSAKSKDPEGVELTETVPTFSTMEPPLHDTPIILLSAHIDTVFPAGTPCIPRDEESRILCPGAADNGAGLTALLALAAALKSAAILPACTILFAANVGEEGEGDLRGMKHLFTASPYAPRIRAVIALEGASTATVVDRALGSRRLRVEITGPGGHSWADFGRPSPITALAEGLAALARLPLPTNPRTTLNCGLISGGTSINSIPSAAQADLDLRSLSTEALDRLEQDVLKTLSKAVQDEARRSRTRDVLRLREALRVTARRIGDRTAGALPHDSALFTSLRAVDRHLNLATEPRVGSTDANLPLSLGIPALAIGSGGAAGGIHTLDEWHDPTHRDLALRRILLLLLDTCSLTLTS